MTTYPTPPGPPAGSYGAPPPPVVGPSDPTAVMGRRIAAYLIDAAIYFGLLVLVFTALAEQASVPSGFGDPCQILRDSGTSNICLNLNDEVFFIPDSGDQSLFGLVGLGYGVVVYVFLQGLTGGSPGKLLLGLRVVNEQGQVCGIGRSIVRTLLWIVDGAPWCFPLVGLITGLTSTGHRRVGDMAASTYVVAKSDLGRPITVGGATGIPNYPPSGPQSAYGNAWTPNPNQPLTTSPGPSAPPWPTSPAPDATTAPPPPAGSAAPPTSADLTPPPPSDTSFPTGTSPAPDPTSTPPAPDDAPLEDPEPVAATEPEPSTPTESETPSGDGPQWDAARNTYIQWDANAGSWLEWSEAEQTWKPISS